MATNKFEKFLNESGLDSDTKSLITEAWETQIAEAKSEIAAELREEFSQKFSHDKTVLVDSLDKFLNAKITAEMEEFAIDKKALVAERVNYKKKLKEHTEMLNTFLMEQLAGEVKQFAGERKQMNEHMAKLEGFLVKKLYEEIQDFRSDKQKLVEQRVKMVSEGKKQLLETKKTFVTRAAALAEEKINSILRSELAQFKDEIVAARENSFGRRIFEAFAGEYMTSYLSEGSEVKKLHKVLESREMEIANLQKKVEQTNTLVESTKAKLNVAKDVARRTKELNSLLSPLGKDKRKVMEELLESVPTEKLVESYNKYLPAVLNESRRSSHTEVRQNLSESTKTTKTGNRSTQYTGEQDELQRELNQIKAMAGIK